jgi:hypothetical protein
MANFPFTMTKDGRDIEIRSATDERNAVANGFRIPTASAFTEFPKMLAHKKYPERTITVATLDEEIAAVSRGYIGRKGDPEGFSRTRANPNPTYEPAEWPKWINGRVVESPEQAQALGLV